MERPPDITRRGLLRAAMAAGAAAPLAGLAPAALARDARPADRGDPWRGLKVGVATYSLSKLPLDAAIKGLVKVGARYASIKDAHLPLDAVASRRKEVARRFLDAGITPLSCGVITLTDDDRALRNAFEYARDAGFATIVCKPTRQSLPKLDALVKEFDIRVAIHNHGPEDKAWPSPLVAWEAIRPFDPRIGVCIDVGHTARCAVDPVAAIRTCAPRLYDLHMKDLESIEAKSRPVEVGRGVLDVRAMFRALLDVGFSHHVGLEYEKDLADPLPGVAESLGYIRGILATMGAA